MLRRWQVADAELLGRAVSESADHLRPWMAWIAHEPVPLDRRRALLAEWEAEWSACGDVFLGTFLDGVVAGGCGLHRRHGPATLDIGYWVHASFLRRGIATTAARLLTDAAFAVEGIEYVEIHHDKANVASAGIPRRLGYVFVGESPDERAAPAELGVDCTWRFARACWQEGRGVGRGGLQRQ